MAMSLQSTEWDKFPNKKWTRWQQITEKESYKLFDEGTWLMILFFWLGREIVSCLRQNIISASPHSLQKQGHQNPNMAPQFSTFSFLFCFAFHIDHSDLALLEERGLWKVRQTKEASRCEEVFIFRLWILSLCYNSQKYRPKDEKKLVFWILINQYVNKTFLSLNLTTDIHSS